MAQRTSPCPNCGALNLRDAKQCSICGTLLSYREIAAPKKTAVTLPPLYESGEGEDDLMARGLWSKPLAGIITLLLCVLISAGLGGFAVYTLSNSDDEPKNSVQKTTASPTSGTVIAVTQPLRFPTNTPPLPPLPLLPTVTPLPPSATPTPTQGPCIQVAGAGDTLYGLALRCGHNHYSIIPIIMETNIGLTCEGCLAEGQSVEIPWPTPTYDPNVNSQRISQEDATAVAMGELPSGNSNEFGTPDPLATYLVEPTLRPGLAWHVIEQDQTLISLVQIYSADAKVFADLNPEISFRQCDYGQHFGGPNCSVVFYIGQRVRVPVPLPTATATPTLTGSETPTPSATPTFNMPMAFAPAEGDSFPASELITLRWSATGTLATNEVYLVTVKNMDTEKVFQARTTELYFVLPSEWQPAGGRMQQLEWTVAIATIDGDQVTSTRNQTSPRHFEWRGR